MDKNDKANNSTEKYVRLAGVLESFKMRQQEMVDRVISHFPSPPINNKISNIVPLSHTCFNEIIEKQQKLFPLFNFSSESLNKVVNGIDSSMMRSMQTLANNQVLFNNQFILSEQWKKKLCFDQNTNEKITMQNAIIGSHYAEIFKVTSLAHAMLADVQLKSIGTDFKIFSNYQEKIKDSFLPFAGAYSKLLDSYKSDIPIILSISPKRSLSTTWAYFNEADLLDSILIENPETDYSTDKESLRNTIRSESINSLDAILSEIDPKLINLKEGAYEALYSKNPDKIRHFAVSTRELIITIIKLLAPDDEKTKELYNSPKYLDKKGRPNRRAKLSYIYRDLKSELYVDFIDQDTSAILAYLSVLNEIIHNSDYQLTNNQCEVLVRRLDTFLLSLGDSKRDN